MISGLKTSVSGGTSSSPITIIRAVNPQTGQISGQSGKTIQIITKSSMRPGVTGQQGTTVLKTVTTTQAGGSLAATSSPGVTTKYITIPVSAAGNLLNLAPGTTVSQVVANTAKIAAPVVSPGQVGRLCFFVKLLHV